MCYKLDTNKQIENLKTVRENYFNSSIDERQQLQTEFYKIQKNMMQFVYQNHSKTEKYKALCTWEPFENGSTDWFDPEWMFGINAGFDVVIGNPPYIGFHKVPDKEYNKKHYYTANGKYDYYVLFIEKAIKLASKTGFVTFICPSYFYKRNYGKNTRSYLLSHTSICYIADFADFQVFETAQTYPCIFGASKANGYSIYKNAFLKNMPILIHNNDYEEKMDDDSFDEYLYNLIGLSDSEKGLIETSIESYKIRGFAPRYSKFILWEVAMSKIKVADFYYGAVLSMLFSHNIKPALIENGNDRQVYDFTTHKAKFTLFVKYRSEKVETKKDGYSSWNFNLKNDMAELSKYLDDVS